MTIRRVAKQIEYSPSAIYKYFEEKDALLHALLLQGFQEMLAILEQVMVQELDPSERLLQIAIAYWDFVWQHSTLYQLMFDLKKPLHEVQEAKAAFLLIRAAIEQWNQANGVRMTDPDAAVDILWATIHGLIALTMAHYIYGGPTRAKDLLAQVINHLLFAWKAPS